MCTLLPPRLISVLTTLWMDWTIQDEDTVKARSHFIGALVRAATPVDPDSPETEADNPFADVMRGGPAGVIAR